MILSAIQSQLRKVLVLGILMSVSFSGAANANLELDPLKSALDQKIIVDGFGEIAYRAPLANATGPVVTLFHGIYGGATHRAFREILPLLDQAGARVYIMDLPGTGESEKPKRVYRIEDMDLFMTRFLETVVQKRSIVVAESLLSAVALKVSATRPDLLARLVLLSPTGIQNLANPPTARELSLFDRIYNDEAAGNSFYDNLINENSIRYFLERAYFNDALVDSVRVQESLMSKTNREQKWLTFSFVGGQLYRPFQEASFGVFVPTLMIFGLNAESVGFDNRVESAEAFLAVRPDFESLVIPECGQSVQREKPEVVLKAILDFSIED